MKSLFRNLAGIVLVALSVWIVWRTASHWIETLRSVENRVVEKATLERNSQPGAIYLDGDSYMWLGFVRESHQGRDWRQHWTRLDNPPTGRPMYWSQPYMTLLVASGKIGSWLTTQPFDRAVEEGAYWVNPFLQILLILVGAAVLWREFGPLAGGLFAVAVGTLGDIGWTFGAFRPDHQSLYTLTTLLSVIFLLAGGMGWLDERHDLRRARAAILLSSCFGALTIWVSAFVQVVMLFGIFLSILWLVFLSPSDREEGTIYRSDLWRWWGWSGTALSVLAYLLEYAPRFPLTMLEVNNPAYALMWGAMGEVLAAVTAWRFGAKNPGRAQLVGAAVCLAIVLGVVGLLFFGPKEFHAIRDPYMARLHNTIGEFFTFPDFNKNVSEAYWRGYGFYGLIFLPALFVANGSSLRIRNWARLWFVFALTFLFMMMAYLQLRWLQSFSVQIALLAAVTVGVGFAEFSWSSAQARRVVVMVVMAILLGQSANFFWRSETTLDEIISAKSNANEIVQQVLNKKMALKLKALKGDQKWRFLAHMDFAPSLGYFAGIPCVVSYYWENLDGLHAATRFFADGSEGEEARAVAKERGWTHVLLAKGDQVSRFFYYVKNGRKTLLDHQDLLTAKLENLSMSVPPWITLDTDLQLAGQGVYQINREQDSIPLESNITIYRILPDKL